LKNKLYNCYFIEELTFSSIKVLISIIISKINNYTYGKIYYIDGNPRLESIFNIYLKFFGVRLEKLEFDFFNIKDDKGKLLGLEAEYYDLVNLKDKILSGIVYNKIDKNNPINSYKRFYIEKNIINNANETRTIKRAIFLKYIALWKIKSKSNFNIIFYMKYRFGSEEIEKYINQQDITIRWEKILLRIDFKKSIILLNKLFSIFKNRVIKIFKEKHRISNKIDLEEKIEQPIICVPFWGNLNLNRPELRSDLFFLSQSKLLSRNILMLFSIPSDPFDLNKSKEIRQHNIKAVSLNSESTIGNTLPIINYHKRKTISFLLKIKELFESNFFKQNNRIIKFYSAKYENEVTFWKSFFKKFNIRLHISWFRNDAGHIAISSALNEIGGISAIYQRSYEGLSNVSLTNIVDLFFSFSRYHSVIETNNKSIIPYHIAVGYMDDYRFKLLKNPAQRIRNKLFNNNAEFIISYFDQNSRDDGRWLYNNEKMRADYEFLIDKVLSNPKLGLIFKPKVSSTLRERLGSTTEILDKAVKTGRCIVLQSTGILKNHYTSAIGAMASDVAIGNKLAGTAALEAALSGTPTLLIDKFGYQDKILDLLDNNIIFDKWENLWESCEEYMNSKSTINNFGDWSFIINDLDPFRDGKAAERVGTYLSWIVAGFNSGKSRDSVLSEAAQRYTTIWGEDKITSVNC